MRVRRMEIYRRLFGRHDLPYSLEIVINGTESEIKAIQQKIMELVNNA